MNIQPLHELLRTEVDRKEFLAYCGATILGVLGVTGLVKTLTQHAPASKSQSSSYGSSPYGGKN